MNSCSFMNLNQSAEESNFIRLTITLFKIQVLIFHQEIDIPMSNHQKFKWKMTRSQRLHPKWTISVKPTLPLFIYLINNLKCYQGWLMELDFSISISLLVLAVTVSELLYKVYYFYLILLVSPAPLFFVFLLELFTRWSVYMLCFHLLKTENGSTGLYITVLEFLCFLEL